MSKRATMLRTQAIVLHRLQEGAATAADLALLVYGESTVDARRGIHVVVHRLRKRGVTILLEQRNRLYPRYYRLATGTICPYCGGTGKLEAIP